MTRFKDKYRVETTRLKGWNYAAGSYFITICTQGRGHFFGEVTNHNMRLSVVGDTAAMYWGDIPRHFPLVTLDAFVVMPDHVHGILIINSPVETRHVASLPAAPPEATPPPSQPAAFGPLPPGSLSKIIQAYKAAVTHWCRENEHLEFAWQPRFYDHIIRNETALARLRQYILDNPAQWELKENVTKEIWI